MGADALALEPGAEHDIHDGTLGAPPGKQLQGRGSEPGQCPPGLVLVAELADQAGRPRRQQEVMPVDRKAGGLPVVDHVIFGQLRDPAEGLSSATEPTI